VVPLETGESVLFGFALHHEATGGLAWLSSSEVLELHAAAGRAQTFSGRRYLLGRRFEPLDVLVEVDRRWLQAMKAARHLGVQPPIRTDAATRAFVDKYQAAYFALRQRGGRPMS